MEARTDLALLCRKTARSVLGYTFAGMALSVALQVLAGCNPGGLYGPCEAPEECDAEEADGCLFEHGQDQPGTCTLICQTDSDCPSGPMGEPAVCVAAPGGAKVCKLEG